MLNPRTFLPPADQGPYCPGKAKAAKMSTDWADIERMGAKARANGFHLADNPFLSDARDPEDTREDWETKRDTWILGWTLEDAFRRQGP